MSVGKSTAAIKLYSATWKALHREMGIEIMFVCCCNEKLFLGSKLCDKIKLIAFNNKPHVFTNRHVFNCPTQVRCYQLRSWSPNQWMNTKRDVRLLPLTELQVTVPILPRNNIRISAGVNHRSSVGQLRFCSRAVLKFKSDWIFRTGEYEDAKCSALLLLHHP